jgi:integrase/recombinase XerD
MVHALRHTYATRLAEDGATATEIQALLGHESLNTSQGYIDATANETRQAARANRTYRVVSQRAPDDRRDDRRGCLLALDHGGRRVDDTRAPGPGGQ